MTSFKKTALTTTAILGLAGMAFADEQATLINGELLDAELTIAENAAKVADFTTLMTAVTEAGLADELLGEGPYTVFAPTNDAFAALPEGTVEGEINIDEVNNRVLMETITDADVAVEKIGDEFYVSAYPEAAEIVDPDAQIIYSDITASNGVIHIIDAVLSPDS